VCVCAWVGGWVGSKRDFFKECLFLMYVCVKNEFMYLLACGRPAAMVFAEYPGKEESVCVCVLE